MELDVLKSAWKVLDQRLEASNRLQLQALRERRLDQLERRLRPLFWGQVAQIVVGALVLLSAVGFWTGHRQELSMLLSGIVLHAYGVVMIMTAGITLGRMRGIDHSVAGDDIAETTRQPAPLLHPQRTVGWAALVVPVDAHHGDAYEGRHRHH